MDLSYYRVNALLEDHRFEYLSVGLTTIQKAIIFYEMDVPFLYSLVLADIEDDGSLSVTRISNNGDLKKNLATVYRTIETFLNNHPRALIVFRGNTEAKTRLYQIAIARYLDRFLERYLIWGVRCDNEKHEPFRLNQTYIGFFVTNKNLPL